MTMFTDSYPVLQINLLTLLLCVGLSWLCDARRQLHRAAFSLLAALLLSRYIAWRYYATLPSTGAGFSSVWSYGFIFFETIAVVYSLLSMLVMVRRRDNCDHADRGERRLRLSADAVPAVDVLICTYNEGLEILEKTIIAAKSIDYPKVNVWVLDDTRRDWLRDFCVDMDVYYVRRDNNLHAKAGNLNNGLRHSAAITNAPYILVLDADFVPQKNILYRTMGLFEDKSVALVQTPQYYYNPDPIQHNLRVSDCWVDEQRVFFDVYQPAKDAWDAAFCVGTSFVIDRAVITSAGGFPTGSVCEDIHTSYLLRQRGYVTRWLDERLSIGLSAETLEEYINQRGRWCLGTMQVALLRTGPLRGRGYSLLDRIHYIHGMLHWISKPFVLMLLLSPFLYWYWGVAAFYATPAAFCAYGLPALIAFWLYSGWITKRTTLPIFTEVTQMVSAPMVTLTLVIACLKPFGPAFKVTTKGIDRSRTVVHWKLAGFFLSMIVALMLGALEHVDMTHLSDGTRFNLAWTMVALVFDVAALMACIDLPRQRGEERFPFDRPCQWRVGDQESDSRFIDISLNGAALRSSSWSIPAVGTAIDIAVSEIGWVSAVVARSTNDVLRVKFQLEGVLRQKMIALIFADAACNVAVTANPRSAFVQFLRQIGFLSPTARVR